MSICYKTQHND